jgi:hypothetical protein
LIRAPRGWALRKLTFNFSSTTRRTIWNSITTWPRSAIRETDAALTNFKTLLELEISLLMGCDTEWAEPSDLAAPDAASAAGAVLGAARPSDDDDVSSNDGAAAAAAPLAAAASAAPAAGAVRGPPAASAAPAAPAPAASAASAAPAAPTGGDGRGGAGGAGEGAAHDPHEFTTWAQETWADIDLSQIQFPTDPCVSICSVWSYHAVALLLVHIPSLRTAHPRVWDELNTAWSNTFHSDLSETALEKWPTTGPLAFSAQQCDWLGRITGCSNRRVSV